MEDSRTYSWGQADDTAANGFNFKCIDLDFNPNSESSSKTAGSQKWGSWESYSDVQSNFLVGGAKARLSGKSSYDKSAFNGLKFKLKEVPKQVDLLEGQWKLKATGVNLDETLYIGAAAEGYLSHNIQRAYRENIEDPPSYMRYEFSSGDNIRMVYRDSDEEAGELRDNAIEVLNMYDTEFVHEECP